jgi:hypothetical protein
LSQALLLGVYTVISVKSHPFEQDFIRLGVTVHAPSIGTATREPGIGRTLGSTLYTIRQMARHQTPGVTATWAEC